MSYRKLKESNFQPTQTNRAKLPVYHDHLNEMLGDNDNELLADSISEKTAGEGIGLKDKFGYGTGAGGVVTQITSATTAVTLNKASGQITSVALTNAAGVDHEFTLTNSEIAAADVVVVSVGTYGGTADGIPVVNVTATAAGSCVINVRNTGAVALDALVVINFAVIKGAIA